jgi:hypothetical protein
MGWTYSERQKGTPDKEWYAREFDHPGGRVVDCASTLGAAFLAYELRDKDTGAARGIIGIVLLTHWTRGAFNFGYKDMTEDMGPCEARCPERILRQLTPVRDLLRAGIFGPHGALNAWHWRRHCQDHLQRRTFEGSRVRALKPGDVLTWPKPISTTLGPVTTLRVVETGRRILLTDGYRRFRFTRAVLATATVSR